MTCRGCDPNFSCGQKGAARTPIGGDIAAEAAATSGIASTTEVRTNIGVENRRKMVIKSFLLGVKVLAGIPYSEGVARGWEGSSYHTERRQCYGCLTNDDVGLHCYSYR